MISGFGRCSQRASAEIARRTGSVHCLQSIEQRSGHTRSFAKTLTGLPCLPGTRTVKGRIARLEKMDGNALLLDNAIVKVITQLVKRPKFAALMQSKINMKVDTAAIDQKIENYEKVVLMSRAGS